MEQEGRASLPGVLCPQHHLCTPQCPCVTSQGTIITPLEQKLTLKPGSTHLSPQLLNSPARNLHVVLFSMHNS